MQIIESIIFILTIVSLGFLIKYKIIKKQYMIILVVVSFFSLIIHLAFESTRWQLYPLYIAIILTIGISLFSIFKINGFQNKGKIRMITLILSGLLMILSGISKYAFPLQEMPLPSGEFSIGTESFVLIDDNREESYGEEGKRKIKIQVWYPAESTDGYDLVPWLEDGQVVAQALAKDTGLPSFVLNHTELIMSNSYLEAPISETFDEYPIVVISHGWGGFKNLHTDLAEELASLGYIVVGIDHTYGSVATVFSDEEIAYLNPEALPDRDTTSDFLGYANTLVNTYAGDITLTLDELEKMNTGDISSRFEGRLDLENIGLLGHSAGSGADVAVAINDDRIKALFGMDAWVEPISDEEIEKGLDIPILFLRSGSWETGANNTNLSILVEDNIGNTRLYQIDGTTHYDFSMAYMYSPLTKNIGMTGELEGDYLVSIFKSMITDFFEQTLKVDNNVGLIEIRDSWIEVRKLR
ncbi:MAG: isoform II [Candidatus Izimaplasma bacterium HR2]|nr:MAG: isoform II [Candidatus Izimaplasma bacterium HR2]